jgi:CBS domain-containing protein
MRKLGCRPARKIAAHNLEQHAGMFVRDVMTAEVLSLDASDSLGLADDLMRLGRIRHMPILSGGRLVGVLSQRDLFRAAISSLLRFRTSTEKEWLAKISIREVMTSPVITVMPTTSVRAAVEMMVEKQIGCLPVIEDDSLVGLISESDCLRYLARLLDISQTKADLPELPSPDE